MEYAHLLSWRHGGYKLSEYKLPTPSLSNEHFQWLAYHFIHKTIHSSELKMLNNTHNFKNPAEKAYVGEADFYQISVVYI
jgi:hypothetical protein